MSALHNGVSLIALCAYCVARARAGVPIMLLLLPFVRDPQRTLEAWWG